MAQRSLSEQISLAIQNKVYEVADKVTTVVDEALEAFEDVAASVEDKVVPVHNITINTDVDHQKVAQEVLANIKHWQTQAANARAAGGSQITPPTLEEVLSVVYDLLRDKEALPDGLEPGRRWGNDYSKAYVVKNHKMSLSDAFDRYVRNHWNDKE